ncbi:hypothetical protein BsWGS_21268 [Bradybaena similaris]
MARVHLLLGILLAYSTCFVKSAPSHLSEPAVVAPVPGHDIQELATSETHRPTTTTTSTDNNSRKTSSASNAMSNRDVVEPGKDASKDKVIQDADTGGKKRGPRSNVMALSDDVITDALFTNIDTLQDHLEVCEEGLRQQLRLHSHGTLLQEVTAEGTDYTNVKGAGSNKGNKNDDKFEDDDDADDEDDGDIASEKYTGGEINDEIMADNKDDAEPPNIKVPTDEPVRRRRSLTRSAERPSGKEENLAQKVVNRLSDRLEYLKASLIQCHLLYRQFGLL